MPRYRNAAGVVVETSEANAARMSGLTRIADRRPAAKKAAAKKAPAKKATALKVADLSQGKQD